MKFRSLLIFLCSIYLGSLKSQVDSLFQDLDRLGFEDVIFEDSIRFKTKVSAASRSLQSISDLPITIFVIDREEIIRNGYITLVDALKSRPGIRVSQPGSALEGETFTMRGLLGNTYAKILINGQPIKPYVVSGMPIGAQLPIQQAERIEIIYGPSAALYGADASSGIINIVIAESERPLFTKASLHLGSDNYKSMNILFGGKLSKGDDVVRFKLFGSDTRFDNRRIFYNTEIYNPSSYALPFENIDQILDDKNYRGTTTEPEIANTPHESRSIGGFAKYRFFSFSFLNMNRNDHSSIGFNPLAVSYANPLITTGENIFSINLKSEFEIKQVQLETTIDFLSYDMNNSSRNLYVNPILESILNRTIADTSQIDALSDQIELNYFAGQRFSDAHSNEKSIEQTVHFSLWKTGTFTAGVKYLIGSGSALKDFQNNISPLRGDTSANLNPAFTDLDIEELSVFIQLFRPIGERFNLLLGGQFLRRINGDYAANINSVNPRIGLLFRQSKRLQLRASYSTAIRAPSPYFNATTYSYENGVYEYLTTGNENLEVERTSAFEIGGRWSIPGQFDIDFSSSYSRTDGFINYNILFKSLQPNRVIEDFTLGYFNDENSKAELLDLQAFIQFQNLIPAIQLSGSLGINYSVGIETLNTTNLSTFENEIIELSGLRGHPTALSRLSLEAKPINGVLFRVDQLLVSRSLTRNSFRLNSTRDRDLGISRYNTGFYTIDMTANYQVNRNFMLYAKFYNILGAEYGGIDASASNDILQFNPQPKFTFHLGLNYEFN